MGDVPNDDLDSTTDHLAQAVKDAHYMLAYFSRARVVIPHEKQADFDAAIRTLSAFRAPSGGSSAEAYPATRSPVVDPKSADGWSHTGAPSVAEFWKAFILLSDLAYPATVESIRYYFRSYYGSDSPGYLAKSAGKAGDDRRWLPRVTRNPFAALTFLALFMTIGLSLLAYIGSTALRDYDADYEHWTQVQIIARALDESATVEFVEPQTEGKKAHLIIERLPVTPVAPGQSASPSMEANAAQPMKLTSTIDGQSTTKYGGADAPPIEEISVPAGDQERIKKILLDVRLGDKTTSSLQYACSPILALFRRARHEKPGDPQALGTMTPEDCQDLLKAVPPHEIMISDDLALTFSSLVAHRQTLLDVVAILKFPWRLIGDPARWAYGKALAISQSAKDQQPQGAVSAEPSGEFVNNTSDAFNLFVLLQQRHAPVPVILPISSARDFSDIVGARLSVAIIHTYLLTLAFGFLGACVFVLREINRRLENFTLAPSLFPRYRARILLGMVAGPTIGLFFDQDGHFLSFATSTTSTASLTNQLSASAIAFVAGFSIEILFAIMDRLIRIIQDFAGGDAHSPATPR